MTEGQLAPEEVRTRTFTRVVRGYRPRQVRRLLERAAKDLARLRDGFAATGADGPPLLTPQEIEDVRFQPAIGGYEMDEVDQFLDQLMVELERAASDPLRPSALPAPPRHAAFPTITPGPQRADFPRPATTGAAESFGRLEERPTGQWMGPLSPPPAGSGTGLPSGPESRYPGGSGTRDPEPPPMPGPPVGVPHPPQGPADVPHPAQGPPVDVSHPHPDPSMGVPHPQPPEGGAPAREGSPTPGVEPRVVHSPRGAGPGAGPGPGDRAEAGAGPATEAGAEAAEAPTAGPDAGRGEGPAASAEVGVGEGPAGPEAGVGERPGPGAGSGVEAPRSAGPLPAAQPPATSDEGFFPPPTMPPSAAPPTPPPPPPTARRPPADADEGFFPPPSVPPSAAPQAPPPRPTAPLAAQVPSTGRPLTPAEVETRNFDRGAPGYLPNHVDLFLARAARAMAGRDGETMTRWDILRQRFPLGPRGYATSEVDAFLVRLAAQFPDPDPEAQEEILRKLQGG